MNITVLGAGAVGSLWACYLQQAGHNVSLWLRSCSTASHSITLSANQIESEHHFACNQVQQLQQCELLLVTTKAWQVEAALRPLISGLKKECSILFMHNGMGAIDSIKSVIDPFPILQATTTHGALTHHRNHVEHTGLGSTIIGGMNARGKQHDVIADIFHHALTSTQWDDNIAFALWKKLAINCVINPLTAIHQCRNGELQQEKHQLEIKGLCQEIALVLQAHYHPYFANDHYKKASLQAPDMFSYQNLLTDIHQVILATQDNYSSMNRDCFYQRKTEIDFITGYLLTLAQRFAIPTPINQRLYDQIKQLEGKML